ncbi:MAG: AAA family ATPase [Candidatus Nanoarchaeia archaeon]
MSDLFNNVLKSNESLFLNEIALDYEYLPPIIKFRESQQKHIATCIQPLLQNRSGRNMIILGSPGIGKSAAVRSVLREMESTSDEVRCIYLNCWKRDSGFKLICDLCEQLGYTWTHNKRMDELVDVAVQLLNKKPAILVFDEVDKLEEQGILYTLLEEVQKKSFILITNDAEFLVNLDQRVKSRLTPELLEFKSYKQDEVEGILKQRVEFAFVPNVFEEEYVNALAAKTFEGQDVRTGLYLLREAGLCAENDASRKVLPKHVDSAVRKISDFKTKTIALLDEEERLVLKIAKENSGVETKDLFILYQKAGGSKGLRTFQRKVKDLVGANMINVKESYAGGKSRIVDYLSPE